MGWSGDKRGHIGAIKWLIINGIWFEKLNSYRKYNEVYQQTFWRCNSNYIYIFIKPPTIDLPRHVSTIAYSHIAHHPPVISGALQSDWLQRSRRRSVRTWASPPTGKHRGSVTQRTERGERCRNTEDGTKAKAGCWYQDCWCLEMLSKYETHFDLKSLYEICTQKPEYELMMISKRIYWFWLKWYLAYVQFRRNHHSKRTKRNKPHPKWLETVQSTRMYTYGPGAQSYIIHSTTTSQKTCMSSAWWKKTKNYPSWIFPTWFLGSLEE